MKDVTENFERLLLPYSRVLFEFIFFSFLGFVYETIFVYTIYGELIARGTFAFGFPIIHLYGMGILMAYYLLNKYRKKPVVLFVYSSAIATLLELVSSYIEDFLYGQRSWDYSSMPLNYQGRISIVISFVWGGLCLLCIFFLYPGVKKEIERMPKKFLVYSSIFLTFYNMLIFFEILKAQLS